MKVKVGDTLYDSENVPIMVILSDDDKRNISNMETSATKYAVVPDKAFMDEEEITEWMNKK